MLTIQNLSYAHPDKDVLFKNIHLNLNSYQKIVLIGNNAVGKSTLLKIIAGELVPTEGSIQVASIPYYIPQITGQFNHLNIEQALGIDQKLKALQEILAGDISMTNYEVLQDDWNIEDRCHEALSYWGLTNLDLKQSLGTLSGGQKTKVFLAGISIHKPDFVLMDEPSNHLDSHGRELLYTFVTSFKKSMIMVSHDRSLLNLIDSTYELTPSGIQIYGGNYKFYVAQKQIENNSLAQQLHAKEKELKKAKEKDRETSERQQKLDARGKGKQEKSGVARIMMNTLRNNAENSSSKLKSIHSAKIEGISHDLETLRSSVNDIEKMKFGFTASTLHNGKVIFHADKINIQYHPGKNLWLDSYDIRIVSGERIAIKGANGSGKTSLVKIILGQKEPSEGNLFKAEILSLYIDQDYSLINNALTIIEQAESFNQHSLLDHEIKIRLARFLFLKEQWNKSCATLSGGEKMRLLLCCITMTQAPDMIVLDEPTNNLDIQNIDILTKAINEYQGTLLVISHDETFLKQIGTVRDITLNN